MSSTLPSRGRPLRSANRSVLLVTRELVLTGAVAVAQPLDGAAIAQVFAHDLVYVLHLHAPIPDAIGIDDDHRAMPTLIEAAAVIDADRLVQSRGGDQLLKARMDAKSVAIHLRTVFAAGADKDVPRPDLAGGLIVRYSVLLVSHRRRLLLN
jgi:hypothetical protein